MKALILTGFAMLALAASGCLPLMVGSLGYEGYEYEKTGTLPGMPVMPSAGSDPQPRQQQSAPTSSDHSIE